MSIAGETRVPSAMVHLEGDLLRCDAHLQQMPPRLTYTDRPTQRLGSWADAAVQLRKGVAVRVDFSSGQYIELRRLVGEK